MISRRAFLKYSGGTALTLFLVDRMGLTKAFAQIPGGTLDPLSIPKYQNPLLIPPAMPKAGSINKRGGRNADYYEISMKQISQQILPEGFPSTVVWGYGALSSKHPKGLLVHHSPSLTIEAKWNQPVRVKWVNDLKNEAGNFLPHILPVDQTLHWAYPPGGVSGRDKKPVFASTPSFYTGPVPMVTHVHGAAGVGDESDGYAEAWYLPDAADIPAGYAREGTWHDFFKNKALAEFESEWGPGFVEFEYPNSQRATTLWYHDHTLGMTRLNVYAGPAGFFIIRGGPGGDAAVIDSRSGTSAVLPGPAPREGDMFPPNKTYREIPIAIQDRSFNADGTLFYPDSRSFFDGIGGPYIPDTDIPPFWNPEFFGNTMMVNGTTWPYLEVEQRRYRFRLLNGCNSRFLILDFAAIPGVELWQIGNEGGFLPQPVNLSRLLMAPAERADVIVDFTNVPAGSYTLANIGPDEPFGGGIPGLDFDPANPASTGQVMEFHVSPAVDPDLTTPPQYLQMPPIEPIGTPTALRRLSLSEGMSAYFPDSPAEARLGVVDWDDIENEGTWEPKSWMEPITENPAVGAVEDWEFFNATEDAHPMHLHEVLFEVISRQNIEVEEYEKSVEYLGPVEPPEPWETGRKDTVIAYPGQVTRIRARFERPGQFVWHCHVVEHEDNEMMRPFRIGPSQPGEP